MNRLISFCALVVLLFVASTAWGQLQYTLTDLGTLPGYMYWMANGINNSGQVVVDAKNSNPGYEHAFLYTNGAVHDLGTFPGGSSTEALGINNSGQVVGDAFNSSGCPNAFLYSNGTMQNLGTLPGDAFSEATAISNSGQIVGYAYNGGLPPVTHSSTATERCRT